MVTQIAHGHKIIVHGHTKIIHGTTQIVHGVLRTTIFSAPPTHISNTIQNYITNLF